MGGPSKHFATSQGARFVDAFANGVAHESKLGFVSMSPRISAQIAKDAELLAGSTVDDVAWHFYRSAATGRIGAAPSVLHALGKAGIRVVYHVGL